MLPFDYACIGEPMMVKCCLFDYACIGEPVMVNVCLLLCYYLIMHAEQVRKNFTEIYLTV